MANNNNSDILFRMLLEQAAQRRRTEPVERVGIFPVYYSISEYLQALPAQEMRNWNSEMYSSWAGGRSFKQAKDYFRNGATESELCSARELLNQIDIHIHGVKGDVWKPQPYGAYPIVPDYLNGDPMSMRSKEQDESYIAPIKVVLDTAVTCDIDVETIARRAAAVTAFTMKLSERRPVEVWIAHGLHHSHKRLDIGWMVRLDAPVNIAQVMAAYSPSVCRKLDLNMAEHLSGSNGVYSGEHYPISLKGIDVHDNRELYASIFRDVLKLAPDDLVLGPAGSFDMEDIDCNPVEWVKNMLIRYGFEAED